jgi:hypothetical protein
MPGTILNAEEWVNWKGHRGIKLTIEYENNILPCFMCTEAPFYYQLEMLCHWTYTPIIRKKDDTRYINLEKFKNKLVPMKSNMYMGRTYWITDTKQIMNNVHWRWYQHDMKRKNAKNLIHQIRPR